MGFREDARINLLILQVLLLPTPSPLPEDN